MEHWPCFDDPDLPSHLLFQPDLSFPCCQNQYLLGENHRTQQDYLYLQQFNHINDKNMAIITTPQSSGNIQCASNVGMRTRSAQHGYTLIDFLHVEWGACLGCLTGCICCTENYYQQQGRTNDNYLGIKKNGISVMCTPISNPHETI